MSQGSTTRLTMLVTFILYCLISTSYGANWNDLFDPNISIWSPIQSSGSLEQANLGFSKFTGYAAAFGDFNADKQYEKTLKKNTKQK